MKCFRSEQPTEESSHTADFSGMSEITSEVHENVSSQGSRYVTEPVMHEGMIHQSYKKSEQGSSDEHEHRPNTLSSTAQKFSFKYPHTTSQRAFDSPYSQQHDALARKFTPPNYKTYLPTNKQVDRARLEMASPLAKPDAAEPSYGGFYGPLSRPIPEVMETNSAPPAYRLRSSSEDKSKSW